MWLMNKDKLFTLNIINSIKFIIRQGGLWLSLGHFITIIGQFVLLKMIAVFGSKELFGQFAIVMLIYSGQHILFYGPLVQWAIRHYQEFLERKRTHEYYVVILILVLFISMVLICSLAVFLIIAEDSRILQNINLSSQLILVSMLFGSIACINELISSIFNAASHPVKSTLFFSAGTWLRVISAYITIQLWTFSLESIIIWMIILQILLLIIQCVFIFYTERNRAKRKFNRRNIAAHISKMKTYIVPFVFWGIPAYVALMGDRWVLAVNVDAASLGVYAAMATATFGVANAVGAAINRAVSPIIFRVSGAGREHDRNMQAGYILNNIFFILLGGYFFFVLVYYLWPGTIISVFTTKEFTYYAKYLWLLMIGASAFNLSQFLITYGLMLKKPKIYVPSKYFHGMLTITLLSILVPKFGVSGAVIAVLVSHICQFIFVFFVNRWVIIQNKSMKLGA